MVEDEQEVEQEPPAHELAEELRSSSLTQDWHAAQREDPRLRALISILEGLPAREVQVDVMAATMVHPRCQLCRVMLSIAVKLVWQELQLQ